MSRSHWLSGWRWTLLLMAGVCLSGCGGMEQTVTGTSAAATHTIPLHTPIPSLSPPPTVETIIRADVVLTVDQGQTATTVQVGQVINLAAAAASEWVVSYRPEILLALTPEEAMSQPGAEGWFFRVLAPGSTELVLESKAVPCQGDAPCAPNVMRFVFPIEAVP